MSIDDAFNIGFETGDATFGDKTTAAGDGAVSVGGDNSGPIISGDGAVAGSGNMVNNGGIRAGDGSPVTFGNFNHVDAESQKALGDIVQDNKGPVFKDIDTGGGAFDVDNSTEVHGNQSNIHAGGDINGDINASNTDIRDSFNQDFSQHDVGNTTNSHNTTDSFNTSTGVTGFDGGDVGLGGIDAGGVLGPVAGGLLGGPAGLLGGAADGIGDVLGDIF